MNIGIPTWGVVSATVKAPTVIPGAVASSENVGAREFGGANLSSSDHVTLRTNLLCQSEALPAIANFLAVNRS